MGRSSRQFCDAEMAVYALAVIALLRDHRPHCSLLPKMYIITRKTAASEPVIATMLTMIIISLELGLCTNQYQTCLYDWAQLFGCRVMPVSRVQWYIKGIVH